MGLFAEVTPARFGYLNGNRNTSLRTHGHYQPQDYSSSFKNNLSENRRVGGSNSPPGSISFPDDILHAYSRLSPRWTLQPLTWDTFVYILNR